MDGVIFVVLIFVANSVYAALPPANGSLYCVPYNLTGDPSTCWPSSDKWETLRKQLSGPLTSLRSSEYEDCIDQGDDAFKIAKTGHGMCMQYHDCSKAFCNKNQRWNIPSYSVEAHNVNDIKAALAFAKEYNIAVTVKTSGHSYAGSSMGYGTLLIWMYNFQKYGNIKSTFNDSCNTSYSNVLRIGGGQPWKEAYDAVGDQYHLIGGSCFTVSAAGGWIMGGGLSAMARNLGIGIDNVLRFEVVLADGSHVVADKCSHSDLFWALRGGGGGTFGVITSAYYKLHPVSQVIFAYLVVSGTATTNSFIDFWVEKSPDLDKRWGGYWTLNTYILYFQGSMEDAKTTFLDEVDKWKMGKSVTTYVKTYISYYAAKGGKGVTTTDKTGSKEFNIANRLIPRDFVVNNPAKMKETLKWMVSNGFYTFNYFLGGVIMDVSDNETAVHPAMRKAIWQINTFDERMIQKLRDVVKNTGAGYNHASKSEPDWQNAFWGANLNSLKLLKKKYDPKKRFNCWHCVGYEEMPLAPASSVATKSSFFIISLCVITYHWVI